MYSLKVHYIVLINSSNNTKYLIVAKFSNINKKSNILIEKYHWYAIYITVENLIYYTVLSMRLKLCQSYGTLRGMLYNNLSFENKKLTNKMPVLLRWWSGPRWLTKSFDKLYYFVCSNFIANIWSNSFNFNYYCN